MFFGIFVLNRILILSIFVFNRVSFFRQEPITLFLDDKQPALMFYECLKLGIKNRNSVLKRVGKSAIFVLNRVRVWGSEPHPPNPRIYRVPPPPGFCAVLFLCGGNLVCFFKNNTHRQRRKGNKEEKKKCRQACSFSRLLGDKFEFVCCLCGGKFVVSKFACGAVRLHACSVHSNALGKSGQQWSLNQLTGRCALCCYIHVYKSLCSLSLFLVQFYHGSGGLLRQR